jgi:hypothetical protein
MRGWPWATYFRVLKAQRRFTPCDAACAVVYREPDYRHRQLLRARRARLRANW